MPFTLQTLAHPIRIDAGGVARIGDTRVTLETVVRRFLMGDAPEEIADAYALELSQAYTVISYYLQHRAEVDAYLLAAEAEEARVGRMIGERSRPAELRDKLLARLAARNRAG